MKFLNKNTKGKHDYDVAFILPGPPVKYPAGGYDIVFRLAHSLNVEGIRSTVIFVLEKSQISKTIFKQVAYYLVNTFFKGKRFSILYHNYNFFAKRILNVDYDFGILKNTDLYLLEKVEEVKFNSKIVIATAWQTAYFVRDLATKREFKPLYLVQNSEDDPSFSGELSNYAKQTYDFSFHKIVINKKVYDRFASENPSFFHVGIDTKFYKYSGSIQKSENFVMFPFRKGESKGFKYAIETIRKLLQFGNEIKFLAFGDVNKNDIPDELEQSIEYYYRPTRMVLRDLYNKAKVFVLPSLVEGMSSPPLEAMACGCAVVVTDNGGINEYIKDGVNGLICPIRDSDCLASKVRYLFENDKIRIDIAKNGLATSQEYTMDNMSNNFITIIRDIKSGL